MIPISRIARRAFGIPGMDQKFTVPAKRADNEAILNAARGILQAAEEHAEVFVNQAGLKPEFFQRFRAAIEDLARILAVKVEGQRRKKAARLAIEKLVKRGVAAVDVLDAIVTPSLESMPDVLANWKSVKRPIEPGGSPGVAAEPDITPAVKVA
jgi:hypothetical protein